MGLGIVNGFRKFCGLGIMRRYGPMARALCSPLAPRLKTVAITVE